jgi:hypothetical protein
VVDWVILLVVKSDAFWMFGAGAFVGKGFKEINSFIDNDVAGISFIVFEGEIVFWELLDRLAGGTDYAFFGKNVGGFSDSTGHDVISVGFISLHIRDDQKDIFINLNLIFVLLNSYGLLFLLFYIFFN